MPQHSLKGYLKQSNSRLQLSYCETWCSLFLSIENADVRQNGWWRRAVMTQMLFIIGNIRKWKFINCFQRQKNRVCCWPIKKYFWIFLSRWLKLRWSWTLRKRGKDFCVKWKTSAFCNNIRNQKSKEKNLPDYHLQELELTELLTAAVLHLSLGTKQWDNISKKNHNKCPYLCSLLSCH